MPERASPLIVSRGSPYQRGRHLGRTVPERVHGTIDAYFRLYAYYARLDRDDVLASAHPFIPVIEDYAPDLLDEMRGIADGAGRDLREIVAINARTEILYGATSGQECTAVGVAPAGSPDGHVRLAQNWDWFASLAGNTVLWALQRDEGPDVLTFTEAGIVGKIGMNALGFGMCVNLLLSDADRAGPAAPMHVILRRLLDISATVGAAIDHLIHTPRGTSCNHLLADRAGAVADVEATPGGAHVILPEDGILTHANHCLAPALASLDRNARDMPETLVRGRRAETLARHGLLGEAEIRSVLSDHDTAPWAICLHVQPERPREEWQQSNASILMDLSDGTFALADGNPCTAAFRPLRVADVLRGFPAVLPEPVASFAAGVPAQ